MVDACHLIKADRNIFIVINGDAHAVLFLGVLHAGGEGLAVIHNTHIPYDGVNHPANANQGYADDGAAYEDQQEGLQLFFTIITHITQICRA